MGLTSFNRSRRAQAEKKETPAPDETKQAKAKPEAKQEKAKK